MHSPFDKTTEDAVITGEPDLIARVDKPQPLELRPLQIELIDSIAAAFREGHKNIMVCAPCAFGKTEVATAMLQKTRENGKRGSFICDRIALINNTSQRFDKYGLPHGVRQASHSRFSPSEPIQVCTIQTLKSRGFIKSELTMHDEAHELQKGARDMLLRREGYSVGLSATPMTRGLGKYFDKIITAATTNQLIEMGLLVPIEAYEYERANMRGVGITSTGEYEEREGEKRCLRIVGDVVSTYQKYGQGKAFICFAFSVAHADELERQFLSAGIIAKCYHYKKSDEENAETLREFKSAGSITKGLISIRSLTRGFDATHVEVLINARPLRKALHEWIQMLGRLIRIHEGKTKGILLDHTDNWSTFFGAVQDYFENGVNELDDGKPKEKKPVAKEEKKPVKCPQCSHVFAGGDFCPACGYIFPKRASPEHERGELVKTTDAMVVRPAALTMEQKAKLFGELKFYGVSRNYAPGWASNKFREFVGVWPNSFKDERPAQPSEETLAKIADSQAKWAKTQRKSAWRHGGRKRPTRELFA